MLHGTHYYSMGSDDTRFWCIGQSVRVDQHHVIVIVIVMGSVDQCALGIECTWGHGHCTINNVIRFVYVDTSSHSQSTDVGICALGLSVSHGELLGSTAYITPGAKEQQASYDLSNHGHVPQPI